ncbi:MAG: hypothetical protein A2018_02815 [Alphaproteobacteria bacterium GWF2_58_20]|nr:MAG: hypothetical protein A2018_02815 [Alphaproteobacteria bacterium GWF2_58_20]
MLKRLLSLLCVLFCLSLPVQAEERITDYHSRIEVLPDARIDVLETIDVISENKNINHGIYRDFPTIYKADNGISRVVPFKVLGVKRDGRDEPFRVEAISGGQRIYAGSPSSTVTPGPHRYQFHYETANLVGYFKDYDEIYWNVTGNFWSFPIDRASAEVILPEGANTMQSHAYTGKVGSKEAAYDSQTTDRGAYFVATRPFGVGEGLTVAVGFTKGVLPEPSPLSRVRLLDFIGLLGVLVTFFVYYHVWQKVGRDPEMGVIVPEYDPPKGISAASARYLLNMDWDDKIFAIGVVSLAVKGWLAIKLEKVLFSKQYQFIGKKSETALEMDEKKLASYVAREGETFVVSQKHWKEVKGAQTGQQQVVLSQMHGKYMSKNGKANVLGVLTALASIAAIAFFGHIRWMFGPEVTLLFIPVGLLGFLVWALVIYPIILMLMGRWSKIKPGLFLFWGVGAFLIYFSLKDSRLKLDDLLSGVDPLVVLELLDVFVIVAMMQVFARLMKAPTTAGQELRRHLLGYKLYLQMAEKERLEFVHPPKMTPERFEQGLPWAMALDVENKWAERFAKECEVMDQTGNGYRPLWYSGIGAFALSDMVSGLSSDLPSTLSSSAQDPSSHSGSGGGGSSGGGGGGGGGGGW